MVKREHSLLSNCALTADEKEQLWQKHRRAAQQRNGPEIIVQALTGKGTKQVLQCWLHRSVSV